MIDNITIRKEYIRLKTQNLGQSFNISKDYDGKTNNFKYKLYKDENPDKEDAYITVIINDTRPGFTIVGSIRKWWFSNKAACRDFDKKSFCDCIEAIAEKLQIPVDDFWFSRVTKLEIGGCVILPKEFKNTISNIVSFPRLKKKNSYGAETRTFEGKAYSVTVYNKGIEMYKSCPVNERVLDKLNDSKFFMRFEIKIRKVSSTIMTGRANSLQNIEQNWNFINNYWEETFNKIEIIDVANIESYLKGHYTRTAFKDLMVINQIKMYGNEYITNTIDLFTGHRKRSVEKKHFTELCKKYESYTSLESKEIVLQAVNRKAKLMK